MIATTTPAASPTPTPAASPAGGGAPLLSIAVARVREGRAVTVEGVVTVNRDLLDGSGRRTVLEDATGAIELYLAAPDASVKAGVRVRATGIVARAWGAPRLRVTAQRVLGSRTPVAHALDVAPGAATEWRLVRVRGTIAELHRSGDRWTAELAAGRLRLLVAGLAGSGIPSTDIGVGRTATIVGIVKRPYPTAKDRRFSILPRSPGRRGDDRERSVPATGRWRGNHAAAPPAPGASQASTAAGSPSADAPDVELRDLDAHLGVDRAGGRTRERRRDRTSSALTTALRPPGVVLEQAAADLAALLAPGDAVNVNGVPEERDGLVLVVSDPAGLVLLGDLGGSGDQADATPSGRDGGAVGGCLGQRICLDGRRIRLAAGRWPRARRGTRPRPDPGGWDHGDRRPARRPRAPDEAAPG